MNVLFLESEQLYDDLLPTGLRQLGCRVRTLTEVLNGELEQELGDCRPDFALTMGWSMFPTPERMEVIRKAADQHRIPLIHWATEDPCWHEQWSVPCVQKLQPDLVVTICAEYVQRYEEMGIRAACLPFGYNHEIFKPVASRPEYTCDIAVVANFYTEQFDRLNRKRSLYALMRPLLDRGYDLKIWGAAWDRAPEFGLPLPDGVWQYYLNHRDAPAVYNSAKIVIGLQNEFDYETNITMRTCEVMGAGGFMLTSRTKAVERMFEHKKHLVMSDSPEETLELVDYYLTHPEERARIAAAGRAEVLSRHTYEDRARNLLEYFSQLNDVRPLNGVFRPVTWPPGPYGTDAWSDGSSSSGSDDVSDEGSSLASNGGDAESDEPAPPPGGATGGMVRSIPRGGVMTAVKTVLALAPHTDDVELGCGGTLARLLEEGAEVYVAAFSTAQESLPPGVPPTTTRDEFTESMRLLGVPKENLQIYDYPVRKLSYHRQDVLEDLVQLRSRIKPDAVFLPTAHDIHQDHQVIAAEGLRAFKEITVWGYELPWNHVDFSATAFVTLERRHLEAKWNALTAYRTQIDLGRPYFQRDLIEGLARVRGVQVKADYAEAFEVARFRW